MKLHRILALALATLSASSVAASDFSGVENFTQTEFSKLAKDFTGAASYKAVTPAESLGIVGFDIGVGVSSTKMEHSDIWKKASGDNATLVMPKVHVHKGLPFDIDVGASLIAVPSSDIKLAGAEIKYSFIKGGTALPAVAVRAAATRLLGVDELDLETRSVELSVSKGFLMLTPYAGVGKVWGTLTPHVARLQKETLSATKVFAGVNLNLGLINVVAETDRTGDNQTISVKLGFRL